MKVGVDPAEWRKLLDQANAGELALDPEIGKGLDKVCDDYLDKLDGLLRTASTVTDITGFGPFPSSQALQDKFKLKATGGDQSIDAVLKQHVDSVQLAKQVVAQAISNFVEQDQQRADQLAGVDIPQ
jgi:pyruvate dehydrogenase complex dehydrogenase (E1) component